MRGGDAERYRRPTSHVRLAGGMFPVGRPVCHRDGRGDVRLAHQLGKLPGLAGQKLKSLLLANAMDKKKTDFFLTSGAAGAESC